MPIWNEELQQWGYFYWEEVSNPIWHGLPRNIDTHRTHHMTTVSFSDSDLLRNKVVDPAWYLLDILDHRTWSPTKDGQSNNCHMECVIVKNAENDSDDFTGVPIELQFNDKPKAKGFIEGFLRGLGVDIKANARYDLKMAVGKKIEAFIENDTYNGRLINRCNHKYRVVRGTETPAAE